MNLDLWMQKMETQGEREKTALGGVLMHAFSLWQVLRHAEGDRWKGRPVIPCVWGMLCAKKIVLPGKRGVPVCQGIGFLAKNLDGSCLIYTVCPIEGVGGSAHNSFCNSFWVLHVSRKPPTSSWPLLFSWETRQQQDLYFPAMFWPATLLTQSKEEGSSCDQTLPWNISPRCLWKSTSYCPPLSSHARLGEPRTCMLTWMGCLSPLLVWGTPSVS